jgi:8-oxo-dGTP pyrophosphatase MutT (NUDIX family)
MLITSRNTRRWITPKGWPKPGLAPHRTAEEEAFEEAGIVGEISKKTVGSYQYRKALKDGTEVRCNVRVFPLRVLKQRDRWPEKNQRRTLWHEPNEALNLIREPSLRRVIQSFVKRHRSKRPERR